MQIWGYWGAGLVIKECKIGVFILSNEEKYNKRNAKLGIGKFLG